MAQVSWWMGDKKLEEGDRFDISKDLTGVCRLTIKKGEASDSGQIICRLEKQEDKTTTNLTVVGKHEKNIVKWLLPCCVETEAAFFLHGSSP